MEPIVSGVNGTMAEGQEFRLFKFSQSDLPPNVMQDPLGVFLYFHLTSPTAFKMYLRVDQVPSEYVFDVDSNLRRQVRRYQDTTPLMTRVTCSPRPPLQSCS